MLLRDIGKCESDKSSVCKNVLKDVLVLLLEKVDHGSADKHVALNDEWLVIKSHVFRERTELWMSPCITPAGRMRSRKEEVGLETKPGCSDNQRRRASSSQSQTQKWDSLFLSNKQRGSSSLQALV